MLNSLSLNLMFPVYSPSQHILLLEQLRLLLHELVVLDVELLLRLISQMLGLSEGTCLLAMVLKPTI